MKTLNPNAQFNFKESKEVNIESIKDIENLISEDGFDELEFYIDDNPVFISYVDGIEWQLYIEGVGLLYGASIENIIKRLEEYILN